MQFVSLRALTDRIHQQIRWFGASACWWAPGMGTTRRAREFMRLLFTSEGLGLNTIRINIGGSVQEDRSDAVSGKPLWRGVLSPLKPDGSYDIRRCPGTWAIIREAMELGTIDNITLFMNSPPSTMTKNGKTNGDKSGVEKQYLSNLREDCYEAYAGYVADVTELYVEAGVPVKYVSPINEPQWEWSGGQEGCHYSPEECVRIFRLTVRALEARKRKNRKLRGVRLSLPETAVWWQHTYVHDFYKLLCTDPEIAPYVDHFCAHSYGTNREQKLDFADYTRQFDCRLPLHQTEWGPMHPIHDVGMDTALELAEVLHDDLNVLHVENWTWWLGVGGVSYTDGLICYDSERDRADFPKRYYVMKQHSRFLLNHRPVDVEASGLPEGVLAGAYLSENGAELVWELTNPGAEPVTVTFDGLPESSVARVYLTSECHNCDRIPDQPAGQPLELDPRSVTTLVFPL